MSTTSILLMMLTLLKNVLVRIILVVIKISTHVYPKPHYKLKQQFRYLHLRTFPRPHQHRFLHQQLLVLQHLHPQIPLTEISIVTTSSDEQSEYSSIFLSINDLFFPV